MIREVQLTNLGPGKSEMSHCELVQLPTAKHCHCMTWATHSDVDTNDLSTTKLVFD